MAFELEKNKNQSLQDSEIKQENIKQGMILPSKNQSERERKKSYTFTLKPSIRNQLSQIAKQQGYNSDSQFLNDLIKNLTK
jgi:hypothetical protein